MSRYLCSELVTVGTPTGETVANLEEIWTEGAVFESEVPFDEETQVEFRGGASSFSGTVKSVENHEFGCRVEVELSPLTPWRVEDFKPRHILDPSQLKSR